MNHIASLRAAHAVLDRLVTEEQRRPQPDSEALGRLKRERLLAKERLLAAERLADRGALVRA